ncbi:MAG: calcineurin-like phosphoesterase C-terminal domain-containing protein [Wenzhouxiangella sp.]|nr:calcineurin-like phosphoesterase C-terminal domain-containing protein [Wenzhouxiangella sp.]
MIRCCWTAALLLALASALQAGDITGRVFLDGAGDGQWAPGKPGIPDVLVSNGREIVRTDAEGRYRLPVHDDMDVFIIQPSGYRVPVNERGLPQMHFSYKRQGSPSLRFGGLPPRELPESLDFALHRRAGDDDSFSCAIVGDPQPYSNQEVSWFRDSAVRYLIEADLGADDCVIYLGDVVGDDLDLLDRLFRLGAQAGAPQWPVIGNHDLDFDATRPEHSADSWRARALPAYYAFELGEVMFVALNNVVYPCGEVDMTRPGREFCSGDSPSYNGRVPEQQIEWLAGLLAKLPPEQLVVLLHHVPLVSFSDADRPQHLTDNAADIHDLLEGRPALSLSGHTHTRENHDPGQWFAGWEEHVGVGPLPFRHIVAGAASGGWWLGDLDVEGVPMALQRMGAPKGILRLEFDCADYVERYHATDGNSTRQQWISFNTPQFRAWYQTLAEGMEQPADERDPVPPVSGHDLEDLQMVTADDLAVGVYLSVNVWLGSASTAVRARIEDSEWMTLTRTQAGQGEGPQRGAMFVDPKSVARKASSSRRAVVSRSGNPRTQGHEAFRGRRYQGIPGPQDRRMPDRNVHLWQLRLPEDLSIGVHRVQVETRDRHGRLTDETVLLEVVEKRPPRFWRHQMWD